MSYQVRIVAGSDGKMYIGAAAIAALERSGGEVEDEEYVYGSQLLHRCVAKRCAYHYIVTPRRAKRNGLTVTCRYSEAVHSREV